MFGLPRRLWRKYVTEVRDQCDRDSAAYLETTSPAAADRRVVFVLLTAAVSLLLVRYLGNPARFQWLPSLLDWLGLDSTADRVTYALTESPDHRFNQRLFWTIARLVGYSLIPILAIRLVMRERVADYGLRWRGMARHWRIYVALLAIVLPFLLVASYGSGFQLKYPYYKLHPGESLWPYFCGWELLYASQFVALEFMFRGFFIHGLRQRLGYAAIFVMVVPYAMIHFHKPMAEAAGAIIAGTALGTLSLKSGSIWWGAAIHITVALGMDLLSLWHQGLLW